MSLRPENVTQYIENGCGRCVFGGTPQCKVKPWVHELHLLTGILRESGLTEEIKWGVPCYTHDGKNILLLSALKESVTVSFFRGAELKDPEGILEKPGEYSRFDRSLRFTGVQRIASLKHAMLSYIQQAVELENSGKRVDYSKDRPLDYPAELVQLFIANPDFDDAFHALTPGRQRGYVIYFSSAKQSKTKTARIEKSMAKIFMGTGWNEQSRPH